MSYAPVDGELRDHVRTQVAVRYQDVDEIAGAAARAMLDAWARADAALAPLIP